MTRREREVRRFATDVLDELSISALPVIPDEVASHKGITVEERSDFPDGIFGAFYKKGSRFGIYLSTACPTPGHRNFSLAHELGHYHVDGHVQALFSRGGVMALSAGGLFRNSKDKHEREADWFASELLAPTRFVQARILSQEPAVEALSQLARDCHASLSMIAIRYAELSDLAVAAVLSHKGVVEWTACSARVREHGWWRRLSRRTEVAPGSATSALARNASAVQRGDQRSSAGYLCEWFEGAPEEVEVEEDAVGLGSFGRVLTLLFAPELPDPDELEEELAEERDDPPDWRDALRSY